MKKMLLFLCMIISAVIVSAQPGGKWEEVVYLKGGGSKRGMIMEYVPNMSLKIKTKDSLLSYKLDEIEKITREQPQGPAPTGPFDFKVKKYVGIIELGTMYRPNTNDNLPWFSFYMVNGYQFNSYIGLGLGVGVDVAKDKIYDIPVAADARFYFLRKKATPFFALAFGFNEHIEPGHFQPADDHTSGMVFNPAFGGRFAIQHKAAISISVGYKLLATHYKFDSQRYFELDHGALLRLGVHF